MKWFFFKENPFLAHLAFRPCEHHFLSVNISHFNLLRKHWANCNQTLMEWSLDGPFQNCVRWSRLPTKMATKLKIEKKRNQILIVHCCHFQIGRRQNWQNFNVLWFQWKLISIFCFKRGPNKGEVYKRNMCINYFLLASQILLLLTTGTLIMPWILIWG